jgi:hypothetical protein
MHPVNDKPLIVQSELTMSTETLSSLTQETVQIYAHTAKTMVKTYRVGAHRALGGFRRRLGKAAAAVKVEQPVKSSIVNVGQQLATFISTRVDALSSVANRTIDAVAKGSSRSLGTVAGGADKFYRAFPSRATETFARINLPAARMSRDLAAQISRGADSVATRVSGASGKAAVAKASAKPARRPAKKVSPAGKTASRAARGSKRTRKA